MISRKHCTHPGTQSYVKQLIRLARVAQPVSNLLSNLVERREQRHVTAPRVAVGRAAGQFLRRRQRDQIVGLPTWTKGARLNGNYGCRIDAGLACASSLVSTCQLLFEVAHYGPSETDRSCARCSTDLENGILPREIFQ